MEHNAFDIYYSFGVGEKSILDTKNDIYIKDMVCDPPEHYKLELNEDEKNQIYDKITWDGLLNIKSDFTEKYYIGHTKNLEKRLKRHNSGLVRSTKAGTSWIVIYTEEYQTKKDAYRRELQIKSFKSGEAFKKLIK